MFVILCYLMCSAEMGKWVCFIYLFLKSKMLQVSYKAALIGAPLKLSWTNSYSVVLAESQ